MEVFKEYAYYYDLFYENKDYAKEVKNVHQLIQKYNKLDVCTKILSMGCGTGRHDIEFNKLGFITKGIDLSEFMIERAMKLERGIEHILPMSFQVADIRSFASEQKYDAAVSLFHVMSYQNKNEDIVRAFSTANHNIECGGVFIFDVWYGPGVLTDRPAVRIKRVEDAANTMIRYAYPVMHPNSNIVDVCYDILVIDKETDVARQIKEVHNMRYYFKPEIEYMLEQTGFKLVACVDCNSLKEPDYNSWTVYFCAIKTKECS